MEFLRSASDTFGNVDIEDRNGVVAVVQHGGLPDGRVNEDLAVAGSFLSGFAEKFRTLQPR